MKIFYSKIVIFAFFLSLMIFLFVLFIVLIAVFKLSFFYIYGFFVLTLAWVSSFVIFMSSKRLAASKTSWIFVIFAIPFFGICFYLLFGRTYYYKKYHRFINRTKDFYKLDDWSLENDFLKANKDNHQRLSLYKFIKNISYKPISHFNHFQFFIDGVEKMESVYKDILKAKKYIHVEYFIISDGFILSLFLKLLEQKSQEGLDVRIIYDGVGSLMDLGIGYIKQLRKHNIKIHCFSPPWSNLGTSTNYRNHRKAIIIDGKVVYFGGINIGNEYIGVTNKFGYWRDNHILIKGAAANIFELNFLQDWEFITQKYIKNKAEYLNYQSPVLNNHLLSHQESSSNEWIHTVENSPSYVDSLHYQLIVKLFASAKKRIWIQTPYLVLSDELIDILKIMANSEVDVKIITPAVADKKTVHFMTRLNYQKLIPHHIEIYEYQNAFYHAKGILIDDDITFLGSTNLDYRSIFLNYELSSVFYSKKVADLFEKQFLKDLTFCKPIKLDNNDKFKFPNNFIYVNFMKVFCKVFEPLL
ncbi:cardiolipin synthase [Mycoplasma sp. SG1]|uniref:cardiolipin synthase n=1 Tax=Mycoplasma sp. SG1 TaxID=2810348 RepID=UPI00202538EA|nr:cardiolipin synthase [Mycoplasma sp. SG1]URM53008.1 cardiolipin synthase [Mycoplasma sp. SG1]